MKDSNDIANLYKTLGQNPNQYQEVVRDEELAQANERWPLIAAMHDSDFSPPPVDRKRRAARVRAPIVALEHENELEEGAHDYHERVESANVIAQLADPALTPTWAPDMHDVPDVVAAEPPQDLIEAGWDAPERTPEQIALAAETARAARASHQAQMISEAQAAKDAQTLRDLKAAEQEQADETAEAKHDSKVEMQAKAVRAGREAAIAKAVQAARAAAVVKAAQVAKDNQTTKARQGVQIAKPTQIATPKRVTSLVQKRESTADVTSKPVSVVTLMNARIRSAGEPRPLAEMFGRLTGGKPELPGAVEGKKSFLFERMKRT
jgi:hypothetical protein